MSEGRSVERMGETPPTAGEMYQQAFLAYRRGDFPLCASLAAAALVGQPDLGPAQVLRAVTLSPGEHVLAVAYYAAACRNAPHDSDGWFNRGVDAETTGRLGLAISCYRRALAVDPLHEGALINGTQLLRIHEHFDEASRLARRLQQLQPANPIGYAHEAVSLIYLGDAEGSDAAFAKAVERSSDPSLLYWEHHFSLLARRRFAEAWRCYESRFACGQFSGVEDMAFDLPRWSGQPGQHVLLYGEQGLGDQLMFASAISDLAQVCRQVSLAVSPALVDLFAASFSEVKVLGVNNGRDHAECARVAAAASAGSTVDAVLAMGSLMTHYRNRLEDFSGRPYLRPSLAAQAFWQKHEPGKGVKKRKRPLRLGLCWASNPAPGRFFSSRRAVHKTMPLDAMSPLVECIPDANCIAITNVSLERFEGDTAIKSRVADVSADLVNLDRTAALLQTLDLLVTVDTGVAHLAGGLGVPVWVLLHSAGDARWGRHGDAESYWYQSARLFWQDSPGDWGSLVAEVCKQLEIFAVNRPMEGRT